MSSQWWHCTLSVRTPTPRVRLGAFTLLYRAGSDIQPSHPPKASLHGELCRLNQASVGLSSAACSDRSEEVQQRPAPKACYGVEIPRTLQMTSASKGKTRTTWFPYWNRSRCPPLAGYTLHHSHCNGVRNLGLPCTASRLGIID